MDTGRAEEAPAGFAEAFDTPPTLCVVERYVAVDELSLLGEILLSTRPLVFGGLCDDVPLLLLRVPPIVRALAVFSIGLLVWEP